MRWRKGKKDGRLLVRTHEGQRAGTFNTLNVFKVMKLGSPHPTSYPLKIMANKHFVRQTEVERIVPQAGLHPKKW